MFVKTSKESIGVWNDVIGLFDIDNYKTELSVDKSDNEINNTGDR